MVVDLVTEALVSILIKYIVTKFSSRVLETLLNFIHKVLCFKIYILRKRQNTVLNIHIQIFLSPYNYLLLVEEFIKPLLN